MSYNNSVRDHRNSDELNRSYQKETHSSRFYKLSSPERNQNRLDANSSSENHYSKSRSGLKEKSHHRKSQKHRRHRHSYDEYYKEFDREKGRYHKERGYTDHHPRSSTSYHKHRYEKMTKSLTELSNKRVEDDLYVHKFKRLKTVIDYQQSEEWEKEDIEMRGEDLQEYAELKVLNTVRVIPKKLVAY